MNDEIKEEIKLDVKELLEENAKDAIELVFKYAELGIKESSTPFDDFLLPALPKLKSVALNYAEKINPND